jgi:hypothetical protein
MGEHYSSMRERDYVEFLQMQEERVTNAAVKIEDEVKELGLGRVLAELVTDPKAFQRKYT